MLGTGVPVEASEANFLFGDYLAACNAKIPLQAIIDVHNGKVDDTKLG